MRKPSAGRSGFAYFSVAAGVFVTAFYSFRMYFRVFHGKENFRHKPFPARAPGRRVARRPLRIRASLMATITITVTALTTITCRTSRPAVVTVPLMAHWRSLRWSIGFLTVGPMLYGNFFQ